MRHRVELLREDLQTTARQHMDYAHPLGITSKSATWKGERTKRVKDDMDDSIGTCQNWTHSRVSGLAYLGRTRSVSSPDACALLPPYLLSDGVRTGDPPLCRLGGTGMPGGAPFHFPGKLIR